MDNMLVQNIKSARNAIEDSMDIDRFTKDSLHARIDDAEECANGNPDKIPLMAQIVARGEVAAVKHTAQFKEQIREAISDMTPNIVDAIYNRLVEVGVVHNKEVCTGVVDKRHIVIRHLEHLWRRAGMISRLVALFLLYKVAIFIIITLNNPGGELMTNLMKLIGV